MTCDVCEGSGVLLPSDFDDRPESRDGVVWVARCDTCRRFRSDEEAVEFVSRATGWSIKRSYDRDDAVDPGQREEAKGQGWYRVFLEVDVADAGMFCCHEEPHGQGTGPQAQA